MMGREWDDLAKEARMLLQRNPRGGTDFWLALCAVLLMEIHDRVIENEMGEVDQETDDDEPWRKK